MYYWLYGGKYNVINIFQMFPKVDLRINNHDKPDNIQAHNIDC